MDQDKWMRQFGYQFDTSSTDPAYLEQIWPTVFVIGAAKGGTTSLARLLFKHPALCRPQGFAMKETFFFQNDASKGDYTWLKHFGQDPRCTRSATQKDFSEGKSPILAGNVQTNIGARHVDASPWMNLLKRAKIAKRIKTVIPTALHNKLKFIAVLREPIDRDLSQYNHMRAHSKKGFTCPETEDQLTKGDYNSFLNITLKCKSAWHSCSSCLRSSIEKGRYEWQLKEWFDTFSPEQFLVLNSNSLQDAKSSPDVMRAVGRFLALAGDEWEEIVKQGFPHSNNGNTNATKSHDGGNISAASSFVKYHLSQLRPELCTQFAEYFHESNKKLYSLLEKSRPRMHSSQPSFAPFPQDPCVEAQGLPHPA